MGMDWASLISAYLQYQAADKASNKKPQYSISPQMEKLFDLMMGQVKYDPTRDYVSSYADSFLKSQNAPGGAMSWKPTFQSDYMKNQQPLPNTALDLSKLPIFQGDSSGKMPWNYGYSGPGIGGAPTDWTNTGSGEAGGGGGSAGGGPGGYFDRNYSRPASGTAGVGRNDNMGAWDNPGNQNGLPGPRAGATPNLPPSFVDKWIQDGIVQTVTSGNNLLLKVGGAVIGFAIMGPAGAPMGWKLTQQGLAWYNKNFGTPPPTNTGGAGGAGSGAGNAGGNP